MALFDEIEFVDPRSGIALERRVTSRLPSGGADAGALIGADAIGYPVVDGVARLTPELARRYAPWLTVQGFHPPESVEAEFQDGASVESFGLQWAWVGEMRTPEDLRWRIAERFALSPETFRGMTVLDAGCGAGDQSRWLLDHGARVVSLDLSEAIDVTARKLRLEPEWAGVQADLLHLPFASRQFDIVYCEGVIQHTGDSGKAVAELARVLKPEGLLLATHYVRSARVSGRARERWQEWIRSRLSGMGRFERQFVTGLLAAGAHAPGLRTVFRKSGTALYSPRMPAFAKTWVNTFDYYGFHRFQRLVSPDEFERMVVECGLSILSREPGVIAARRRLDSARES